MLKIESEVETDGRWIAEVAALPGVLAYGRSKAEAEDKAKRLGDQTTGGLASRPATHGLSRLRLRIPRSR
jgi:predicted RNase H-like HicB family nuclease